MPWKSFPSFEVKFASVSLWLKVAVPSKVKNIKVANKKLHIKLTCKLYIEHTDFKTIQFQVINIPFNVYNAF